MLKKILLSFLASLIILFSLAPYFPARAEDSTSTWYNSSFSEWYSKVYDKSNPSEIYGERYTAAQVQWVVYSLFAFLINSTTNANLVQCFLLNTGDIAPCIKILKGLISTKTESSHLATNINNQSLLSLVFANRPLSGITYIRSALQRFKMIPEAKAQVPGFGFNALEPIQSMWKSFRDISYGLFVLIAVILAFMIMFRVKINPQTIITVQSAIPKVVIALILATFSYAIAGFLVDFMYIVIGLFSLIGSNLIPSVTIQPAVLFRFLTLGQPFNINLQAGVLPLLGIYLITFFFALISLLFYNFGLAGAALAGVGIAALIASGIGNILLLIGLIIIIIAIVMLLWNTLKTIWMLLKAFVNILLLTIFAPLQITAGAVIPNFGFGAWVKSFLANLSTFVVVGILIFFSFAFLIQGCVLGFNSMLGEKFGFGEMFVKFLFGSSSIDIVLGNTSAAWPPLLGSTSGMIGLLFLGVSFVLFTMIPKAADIVKSFIEGKPFAYGTAIGESLVVAGPSAYYMGQRASKGESLLPYLPVFPKLGIKEKSTVTELMAKVDALRGFFGKKPR